MRETVSNITGLTLLALDAEGREMAGAANPSPLCRGRYHDTAASAVCAASNTYGVTHAFARGDSIDFENGFINIVGEKKQKGAKSNRDVQSLPEGAALVLCPKIRKKNAISPLPSVESIGFC